jgi:hypothetical protein
MSSTFAECVEWARDLAKRRRWGRVLVWRDGPDRYDAGFACAWRKHGSPAVAHVEPVPPNAVERWPLTERERLALLDAGFTLYADYMQTDAAPDGWTEVGGPTD